MRLNTEIQIDFKILDDILLSGNVPHDGNTCLAMDVIHLCPHCGESYYRELYFTCTALAWTPVYKDGVFMNSNPNHGTVHCECLNCGKQFSFEE